MKPISRPLVQALSLALLMASAAPVLAQPPSHSLGPQRLSGYWVLLNTKVDVDVPNSGANLYQPGCAAVSYIIGSDGVPRGITIRKVVPKGDLGKVAVSAVSHFRYGPSLTNRIHEPVATYYVVPFNAPDDKVKQQQLMAPCRLAGYDEG